MNERNRLLFTGRSRRFSLTKIALAFLLLFFFCAWVYAAPQAEASPFSETLKTPPAFIPEFMAERENAAALYDDRIHAVYAADRAGSHGTPSVTESKAAGNNWSLGIKAMPSPVLEDHGNVQRHESLGGMVEGTLHF